jgi:hypothetical protein
LAVDVAGVALAAGVLIPDWAPAGVSARRPVLGVPEGPYLAQAEPAMLAHFRKLCAQLASGYAVKSAAMPDFEAIRERQM